MNEALSTVLAQLCSPARADGRGPVIALTAAHSGAGTSYVARHLALLAARHYAPYGKRVVLIDQDLSSQDQAAYFRSNAAVQAYGALSGPYDSTFGVSPFWQVSPDQIDQAGQRLSAARYGGLFLVGQTGLAVTEFLWNQLRPGQNVHVTAAREYWHKLRDEFALVIVDTPAFDRGDTALTIIPEADKTVIISAPDRAADPAQKQLMDRIVEAQGRCAGLVINEGATLMLTGQAG